MRWFGKRKLLKCNRRGDKGTKRRGRWRITFIDYIFIEYQKLIIWGNGKESNGIEWCRGTSRSWIYYMAKNMNEMNLHTLNKRHFLTWKYFKKNYLASTTKVNDLPKLLSSPCSEPLDSGESEQLTHNHEQKLVTANVTV